MSHAALVIITLIIHIGTPRHHHPPRPTTIPNVIRYVWCGKRSCWQGARAVKIAWCESSYRTWVWNGEHYGLFQMGSWERRHFGDGSNVWAQAAAAHRYYLRSGWSPWYASIGCWG